MRLTLVLVLKTKQKIWISLMLLVGVLSFTSLSSSSASSLPFRQFKDQWVTASNQDVLNARCSRKIPFTDHEMKEWLDQKASEDRQRVSLSVHGIKLVDESLYLADLLRALLTKDEGSTRPQRTFESRCKKVICAVKEVFGEREGFQLLFMLGGFGFNGSHLRADDASAWTSQELDTVLLALSDLPQELTPASPLTFNRHLIHNRRGKLNLENDDALASTTVSGIRIFDPWNEYSVEMQRYSFYHEVGHIFGFESDLHTSNRWYAASGWIQKASDGIQRRDLPAISKYAEIRPIEDFAESFSAYRYNPDKLRRSLPRAYDFMKTEVFKDAEYLKDGNCHPSYPEPLDVLEALEELKRSIPINSASLSSIPLSDEEIERTRQECLSGPGLVSAFVSGKLLQASAQCVQKSEIKRAVENAAGQSTVLKGLSAEWVSRKIDLQSLAEKNTQIECTQNCKNLAWKALSRLERAIELVLVGYIDLGDGRDKQTVQKFCSDLSFTNANSIRGYSEVQELIGENGLDDLINASVQVCKVIQGKFKKRKAMDADQIEAALIKLYPYVR